MRAVSETRAFRSTTCGSSTCLRLKARSWRTRRAARSAAPMTCCTFRRRGSSASRPRRSSSPCPMMTMSRLLKSWAMPPASRPTASIFWDWRSCSSSRRRSSSASRRSVTSEEHRRHHPGRRLEGVHLVHAAKAVVAVGDLGHPGAALRADAAVVVRDLGAGEAREGLLDRPARQGVHREPEDPVARGIRAGEDEAVRRLEAVEVDPHRGGLDDRAEPGLGLAQPLLGRAPLLRPPCAGRRWRAAARRSRGGPSPPGSAGWPGRRTAPPPSPGSPRGAASGAGRRPR